MKYLFLILLTIQTSFALIITPEAALKNSFGAQTVTKKAMLLTKKEQLQVQKLSQTKLNSKLFRLYTAKKDKQSIGFGILLTRKVRSKTTAVLYMVNTDGTLKNIEIIAFNEPKEYLPNTRWLGQFSANQTDRFVLNDNISAITGATLSANALIKVANVAKAIWKVKLSK